MGSEELRDRMHSVENELAGTQLHLNEVASTLDHLQDRQRSARSPEMAKDDAMELAEACDEKRREIAAMAQDVMSLNQLKDLQAQILTDREVLIKAREHMNMLEQQRDSAFEAKDREAEQRRTLEQDMEAMQSRLQRLESERAELIDARTQAEQQRALAEQARRSSPSSTATSPSRGRGKLSFQEQAAELARLNRENQALREQQKNLVVALDAQEAFINKLHEFEESVRAMEGATCSALEQEQRLSQLQELAQRQQQDQLQQQEQHEQLQRLLQEELELQQEREELQQQEERLQQEALLQQEEVGLQQQQQHQYVYSPPPHSVHTYMYNICIIHLYIYNIVHVFAAAAAAAFGTRVSIPCYIYTFVIDIIHLYIFIYGIIHVYMYVGTRVSIPRTCSRQPFLTKPTV